MPQKGKETPGAMPGRALWDSRPVVPRDWGPLSAVAEDGDGEGEALLENSMLFIPRVLTTSTGTRVKASRSEPGWGVCHPCLELTKDAYGCQAPECAKGPLNEAVQSVEDSSGCHGKRPSTKHGVTEFAWLRPRQAWL